MKCPFCGHNETQVAETRDTDDLNSIRRRRQCGSCEKRFTTYERAEMILPAIIKRDGRRTEYTRKKLSASMLLALRKRNASMDDVEAAINRIEEKLLLLGEREVPSMVLGEMVMEQLKQLDQVAYIRFASVYQSFNDPQAFSAIAKALEGAMGNKIA